MKHVFLAVFGLLLTKVVVAQSGPTYAGSVAGIIYQNCTKCHNTGGIAPFALESYGQAVNNAEPIKAAVSNRHMPPWPPDPTFKHFANERILSQAQIDSIVAWVDAGTPRGNAATEPAVPVFTSNTQMAYPIDTLYRLPTYTISSNLDLYRCFVVPAGVSVQKFLRGIEVVAGNAAVVHHMLLFTDTTGICRQLDAADPEPGYVSFGGTGSDASVLVQGWAPGSGPMQFPAEFGMRVTSRTDFVLQIHYAPGSLNLKDSSYFRLSYAPAGTTKRLVYNAPILNHTTNLLNGPLALAPNTKKEFRARFTLPFKVTLMSVFPHAHLICQNWKVYALRPSALADTIPIIKIPEWHFHWQGYYTFLKPVVLEPLMRLEARAWYNNTSSNPYNPFNPPRQIVEGENTTDEMYLVYFTFTPYETGDENLALTVTSGVQKAQTTVLWHVRDGYLMGPAGATAQSWELRSMDGKLLQYGPPTAQIPLASQPAGTYLLYVQDKKGAVQALRIPGGGVGW